MSKLLKLIAVAALAIALFSCSKSEKPEAAPDTTLSPDFTQQSSMLEGALKDDPTNVSLLVKLGNLYFDWGQQEVDKGANEGAAAKWTKGIEYYGRALEKDEKNVDVRTDMGSLMRYLGKTDEALAQFRKGVEIDPKHAQARINLILTLAEGKQDFKGAASEYDSMVKAIPEQANNLALKQEVETYREKAKGVKK